VAAADAQRPLPQRRLCKHAVVERDAIDGELFDEWRVRRAREGAHVDVIDLYELVAASRGIEPDDLSLEERKVLAGRAMEVIWPGFEKVADSGGRGGSVELVPYDPTWPARFEAWRDRLAGPLDGVATRIAHIGSTSVPGLSAKAIVDVMVCVDDVEDEPRYVPQCEAAGLTLISRDDEHRFLVTTGPRPIDVHVHVCATGGNFERDHLLFRDFLRTHDEARDAYDAMKQEVARRWREDRMGYTYSKSDLILELLERAEEWATATGWTLDADDA
jgi:GrpB-like predicted nucleotidyltransferase (UPF0157 family)